MSTSIQLKQAVEVLTCSTVFLMNGFTMKSKVTVSKRSELPSGVSVVGVNNPILDADFEVRFRRHATPTPPQHGRQHKRQLDRFLTLR